MVMTMDYGMTSTRCVASLIPIILHLDSGGQCEVDRASLRRGVLVNTRVPFACDIGVEGRIGHQRKTRVLVLGNHPD